MLAASAQWLATDRDPCVLLSGLHNDCLGGKQREIETLGSLFYLGSDIDRVSKHREFKAMFVTDKSIVHLTAMSRC
ncbi:hypothetical protein SAMN03159448_06805 [Sinorhizobium sp. NFACC03]|nr:hypothetical protein SAMN03159448_06805 [Sinorhizobium sp. NFACC03]